MYEVRVRANVALYFCLPSATKALECEVITEINKQKDASEFATCGQAIQDLGSWPEDRCHHCTHEPHAMGDGRGEIGAHTSSCPTDSLCRSNPVRRDTPANENDI